MMAAERLRYQLGKPEDYSKVLDFLISYFVKEEPISKAIGLTADDAKSFIPAIVKEALKDPVSFLVFNTKLELIACRLSCIYRKEEHMNKAAAKIDDPMPTEAASKVTKFLDKMEEGLWQLIPNCDQILKFHIVSVRPDYYRKGIAQTSIEKSIQLARVLDLNGCLSTCTAFNSQQLFEKLGFNTLRSVAHSDYKDDEGRQIMKCHDKTECAKLMFMPLP